MGKATPLPAEGPVNLNSRTETATPRPEAGSFLNTLSFKRPFLASSRRSRLCSRAPSVRTASDTSSVDSRRMLTGPATTVKKAPSGWSTGNAPSGFPVRLGARLRVRHGRGDLLVPDLRRLGRRDLVRAGVPERLAMAIIGHRTRAIFDRYNITSEDDLQEAAAKVQAYVSGKREAAKVAKSNPA